MVSGAGSCEGHPTCVPGQSRERRDSSVLSALCDPASAPGDGHSLFSNGAGSNSSPPPLRLSYHRAARASEGTSTMSFSQHLAHSRCSISACWALRWVDGWAHGWLHGWVDTRKDTLG